MIDAIKMGSKPEQLIFANPVKQPSMIRTAKELGIKKMTFDSQEEL